MRGICGKQRSEHAHAYLMALWHKKVNDSITSREIRNKTTRKHACIPKIEDVAHKIAHILRPWSGKSRNTSYIHVHGGKMLHMTKVEIQDTKITKALESHEIETLQHVGKQKKEPTHACEVEYDARAKYWTCTHSHQVKHVARNTASWNARTPQRKKLCSWMMLRTIWTYSTHQGWKMRKETVSALLIRMRQKMRSTKKTNSIQDLENEGHKKWTHSHELEDVAHKKMNALIRARRCGAHKGARARMS